MARRRSHRRRGLQQCQAGARLKRTIDFNLRFEIVSRDHNFYPHVFRTMNGTPTNKILIVEDEPDVVDLLTLQLRKAGGFFAITAADGAEGLKKARAESPALIVLDLMLPRM